MNLARITAYIVCFFIWITSNAYAIDWFEIIPGQWSLTKDGNEIVTYTDPIYFSRDGDEFQCLNDDGVTASGYRTLKVPTIEKRKKDEVPNDSILVEIEFVSQGGDSERIKYTGKYRKDEGKELIYLWSDKDQQGVLSALWPSGDENSTDSDEPGKDRWEALEKIPGIIIMRKLQE